MILSKVYEDAEHRLERNEITLGEFERLVDIEVIEPTRGEWIRDRYWSRGVGMGEEYGFFYKCSLCEYEVESGYTRCGFNFCPYCGADMREREGE